MKKYIKSNQFTADYRPSEYLHDCINQGQIGVWDVVNEFMKYVSEDDIENIITALGLNDEE